jgi:hypothetical protein
MDKKLAKIVQDEATEALRAVAAKYGFTVRQHGGTIGDLSNIFKFEFTPAGEALAGAEKAEFERYAYLFRLQPEDYGATFIANGKTFTLSGFDMKRRKFPIRATGPDGKTLCFTDMVVDRIIQNRTKVAS